MSELTELRAVVDELVVRQEAMLTAVLRCASSVYLIETGEQPGHTTDALSTLVNELGPLVFTPEQLRYARDS